MKVLTVHPKVGSAIERLSALNAKYNPHIDYRFAEIHPKRPDAIELSRFAQNLEWADVVDYQYWKSAEKLREVFGDVIFKKPCILTHHNPYDLLAKEWKEYTVNVVMNKTQQKVLKNAVHIPHAVDFDTFKWNEDYTEDKTVIMVAQRIEGSKGVEEVARACKELGYKMILVGQISDAEYFQRVVSNNVYFYENVSDAELVKLYHKSAIHVCNSKDNFESGTLPILEAMACGVPVLTRRIGHIPDIENGKNLRVRDGQPDDFEELKANLSIMMNDREMRLKLREEGWQTVKTMDAERRAARYSKLYNKIFYKNALVSVIIPVCGKPETILPVLEAYDKQTYKAIELVIVSDADISFDTMSIPDNFSKTVKYARVGYEDRYGLGYARDYGVMMAEGEILVFNDQRFVPEPDAIENFVTRLTEKHWLFGEKGGRKTNFVENFSCLYRQEFIDAGMSNQLMDMYGGMSQELRERFKRQGFKLDYVPEAKAKQQYGTHSSANRKEQTRKMKDRLWKLNLT